jgi:hypothetical protein
MRRVGYHKPEGEKLTPNVQQACAALAVPRASFYRWQDPEEDEREERQRPAPPLALSGEEERVVLEILHCWAHRNAPVRLEI